LKQKSFFIVFFVLLLTLVFSNHSFAANKYRYEYDENNRLEYIYENDVLVISFIYDDNGNLIEKKYLLQAPSNFKAGTITDTRVELSWNAIAMASGYYIYQDGVKVGVSFTANNASINVKPNTAYTFEVSAFNENGEGPKSTKLTIQTLPTPTLAPTGLIANNIQSRSLTLSWNPVQGASQYYIYQKSPNSTMYSKVGTSLGNSFDVSNLAVNTSYSFVIRAYNGNLSANSNELQVTTLNVLDADTFEPNDTISSAHSINLDTTESYIFSSSDVDYYHIFGDVIGSLNISLNSPNYKDYDIYLYSSSGNLLASGSGIGNYDQISYRNSGGDYYIKVVGNGDYSTSMSYSLSVNISSTGGSTCDSSRFVCPDDGATTMSLAFSNDTSTDIIQDPATPIELSSDAISTIDSFYQVNSSLEQKIKLYELLGEVGMSGDIQWLRDRTLITSDSEEHKWIKWTIAKLGYKYSINNPKKAFSYIESLLDEEDEQIRKWVYEKLVELTKDSPAVENFLNKYEEKKKEKKKEN
jgi:chitodextrinase